MTQIPGKAQQAKILTQSALRLMNALAAAGFEARVVGGAVRDVLLGRQVGDIDLASTAPPERAVEILSRQGIKTAPTGLAHGTVTAVIDHAGYEITTLRRDVATDGRHAQIAFTDDWRADAARRDFTFNALYLDASGSLYDYFGGAEDAAAGRVRFIGDARTRIREDVLRILRFFRFYAWFGRGEADAEALAACRDLAGLIPRLSAERVAREMLKLLAAENPASAWELMIENGITRHFAAEATDIARLRTLLRNEKQCDEKPNALLRLAALLPQSESAAAAVAERMRFSNRDREKICVYAKLPSMMPEKFDRLALRRLVQMYGAENCRAALMLSGQEIAQSLEVIDSWENPIFPVKGEDIVGRGVPAGAQVGEILQRIKDWWAENDFRADRAACLAQIDKYRNPP